MKGEKMGKRKATAGDKAEGEGKRGKREKEGGKKRRGKRKGGKRKGEKEGREKEGGKKKRRGKIKGGKRKGGKRKGGEGKGGEGLNPARADSTGALGPCSCDRDSGRGLSCVYPAHALPFPGTAGSWHQSHSGTKTRLPGLIVPPVSPRSCSSC